MGRMIGEAKMPNSPTSRPPELLRRQGRHSTESTSLLRVADDGVGGKLGGRTAVFLPPPTAACRPAVPSPHVRRDA
jgi:hypothetical protein